MSNDAAFWNGLAEKYSRQAVADPEAFERKIALTKARMKPSDVVLDIGCGTGSLALRLAPSAAHVHGLDFSSEMIRIANGKAAAQNVRNVTFHVRRFEDGVPFEPGSLDGICAYSLLHLVADRASALKRIYELLTPGVPPKQQVLRTSYMATHERHHLDQALEAFKKVGKKFGVI